MQAHAEQHQNCMHERSARHALQAHSGPLGLRRQATCRGQLTASNHPNGMAHTIMSRNHSSSWRPTRPLAHA
eukprot:5397972-Lingulodinium_polyedra.AAC.1